MKELTLRELDNRLPIPNAVGVRHTFKFRPWRMAEEKKIGEIKKSHKHLGRFVREVFDYMLAELNGKTWQETDKNERKLELGQMSWGNIYYMWCYLRNDALGSEMKMMAMTCPACEHEIQGFRADLMSLEVHCANMDEEGNDLKPEDFKNDTEYELKRPFTHGEVKVTKLKYGFTPWLAMEKIPAQEKNAGQIKESMMAASLVGAMTEEGGDQVIQLDKMKILEQLTKRDIEGYYDALDEWNGGPVLALEVECPSCGHKELSPLNWTYDYFFGNGSL